MLYPCRPPVRFLDDEELAYVAQRSREIHDFWHVLFGCHTNVFGELALKAVEFVQARFCFLPCHGKVAYCALMTMNRACAPQTGLPMTALSVMGAQWRLKTADRAVLLSEFLPWAVRAGGRSADLMCLYYEEHFEVIGTQHDSRCGLPGLSCQKLICGASRRTLMS